jgi:hypothetical protein
MKTHFKKERSMKICSKKYRKRRMLLQQLNEERLHQAVRQKTAQLQEQMAILTQCNLLVFYRVARDSLVCCALIW